MIGCDGCKYWSDRIAESIGGGPVKAMCMHDKSHGKPWEDQMTYLGCEDREEGQALDDPAREYDEHEANAAEEDALREMGLDDAVDFGLEDVGCK